MIRHCLLCSIAPIACGPAVPGIITATAGESGSGGGSHAETSSSTSTAPTIGDTTVEPSPPDLPIERLDLAGPDLCDGPCGYGFHCSALAGGRSVAVRPDGVSITASYGSDAPILRFHVATPNDEWLELSDPPTAISTVAVALDKWARAALLVGRDDGYALQLRPADDYELDWQADEPPADSGIRLIATDVAMLPNGTSFVTGYTIDDAVGPSSTELFLHTYPPDGAPVWRWSVPTPVEAPPLLFRDTTEEWDAIAIWLTEDEASHVYSVRQLDSTGEVFATHELVAELAIVDRPARRSDGWVAVGPADNGIALHTMDASFQIGEVFYDLPVPQELSSPERVMTVDDGMVVFYRDGAGELGVNLYDSLGHQFELREGWDSDQPAYIVDLAADVDGRGAILYGATRDEADQACFFEFYSE